MLIRTNHQQQYLNLINGVSLKNSMRFFLEKEQIKKIALVALPAFLNIAFLFTGIYMKKNVFLLTRISMILLITYYFFVSKFFHIQKQNLTRFRISINYYLYYSLFTISTITKLIPSLIISTAENLFYFRILYNLVKKIKKEDKIKNYISKSDYFINSNSIEVLKKEIENNLIRLKNENIGISENLLNKLIRLKMDVEGIHSIKSLESDHYLEREIRAQIEEIIRVQSNFYALIKKIVLRMTIDSDEATMRENLRSIAASSLSSSPTFFEVFNESKECQKISFVKTMQRIFDKEMALIEARLFHRKEKVQEWMNASKEGNSSVEKLAFLYRFILIQEYQANRLVDFFKKIKTVKIPEIERLKEWSDLIQDAKSSYDEQHQDKGDALLISPSETFYEMGWRQEELKNALRLDPKFTSAEASVLIDKSLEDLGLNTNRKIHQFFEKTPDKYTRIEKLSNLRNSS